MIHSKQIQQAAKKNNETPIQLCDRVSDTFRSLFDQMDVAYDRFIRTTEPSHARTVSQFWSILEQKGFLYRSKYEGWYCTADEEFVGEADVEQKTVQVLSATGGKTQETKHFSKLSGREVDWVSEENFKFRLSAFEEPLKKWLTDNPDCIYPKSYHNEIVAILNTGLKDVSVSRSVNRVQWGIACPSEPTQSVYVWFDALLNYLTAALDKEGTTLASDPTGPQKWWPPNTQIVGKDILRFHAVIWPCMLLAAGLEPPRRIVSHGHFTVDRQKMSKSAGNVLHPKDLIDSFGLEPFRYFMLWSGCLHSDGDYSDDLARLRINADLSNQLGNLLTRAASPSINFHSNYPVRPDLATCFPGEALIQASRFVDMINGLSETVDGLYSNCEFRQAFEEIFKVLHTANQFFQSEAPWTLCPKANSPPPSASDLSRLDAILYLSFEALRVCAILLQPVLPKASSLLLDKFCVPSDCRSFSEAQYGLHASESAVVMSPSTPLLFPRKMKEEKPLPPITKPAKKNGKKSSPPS